MIQGQCLKEYISKKRKSRDSHWNLCLNVEEVLCISMKIMKAVKIIHDNGFVHRDLKVENIMYNEPNKEVTLIDFGVVGIIN